jgi:hypothetical protein
MSAIAEQIRRAREQWVTAGGFEFKIRRPTYVQIAKWRDLAPDEFLGRCVVDWKIPGHELAPGGGGKVPQFDVEDFLEWVGDRPAVVNELTDVVLKVMSEHGARREGLEKNS